MKPLVLTLHASGNKTVLVNPMAIHTVTESSINCSITVITFGPGDDYIEVAESVEEILDGLRLLGWDGK